MQFEAKEYYQASLERLIELADYPELRRTQTAARQQGRLQGIGISTYVEEAAGFGEDRATARLELDGTITVVSPVGGGTKISALIPTIQPTPLPV